MSKSASQVTMSSLKERRKSRFNVSRWLLGSVLVLACLWTLDRLYPPPSLTLDYSTRVYDRHGELMYRFASPATGVYRYPREDNQIPPYYEDALLAFEDRWFYYHPGVNPFALLRGVWQWGSSGEIVSGGSTLTMQLARMMEGIPRTVGGKFHQMARALQYEWHYSKEEILNAYIDKVPMGGALEGVEVASHQYFSLPASALTLSQSLVLAGIPQNPEQLRPDLYANRALEQRKKLLRRYGAIRTLSNEALNRIGNESLVLAPSPVPQIGYWTAEALRSKYPTRTRLSATLDSKLQRQVQNRLDRMQYRRDEGAAVVVLNNATGEVIARAGNTLQGESAQRQWLDLTQSVRSPGSTLKPFLYAEALSRKLVHSESLLSDVPVSFHGYRPGNFNRRFHGAVSLSEALQHSLNVPAVALLNKLSVDDFSELLLQANLHQSKTPANLSLVLGGTGTRLMDLVGAYRALAVGGERIEPIESVLEKARAQSWLDPNAAWVVADALSHVAPPSGYLSRRKVAWKTGTSWGGRDAWAIGVSADYTVGVWLGSVRGVSNPDRSGYHDAGTVLFDVVNLLPEDKTQWKKPSAVKSANICWPGGRNVQAVAHAQCEQQRTAWTIDGVTPATLDTAPNQWPSELVHWQKDKRIADVWQGPPVIESLNDEQHIGAPVVPIQLQASSQGEVDWYLNGKILSNGVLEPGIDLGEHQLSAVDDAGRSSNITFTVQ